jgi:hypothetical protein
MALSHITDFVTSQAARVLSQYRTAPKMMALIAQLNSAVQEVEDALWDIVAQLSVGTAQGVWLDNLGRIVGEARQGAIDATYRLFIAARIIANSSNGTIEDVLKVARATVGSTIGGGLVVVEWTIDAMTLTVPASIQVFGPSVNLDILKRLIQLLRAARAAAVKLTVLYQDDVDAQIFVCGDATGAITPTGKGFDDAAAPNDPTAGRLSGADDA